MKILIAGLGYLGQQLANILQPKHHVYGVKRSSIEASFPIYTTDLRYFEQLQSLPEVDAVVICVSAGGRSESAYRATYLGATQNLRRRFPNARLLFVSSTSVYGQVSGEELTEESLPLPVTESAVVLRETENLMLNDPNAMVVRPSGIYGPGRTRFISQLAERPDGIPIDNSSCRTNRIHRDDLASLIARLLEQSEPPSLVLATDKDPATIEEVDQWLRSQSFFAAFQGMLQGSVPLVPAQFSRRKSRNLRSLRLAEMEFPFAYPSFREGYSALIQASLSTRQVGHTPTT